MDNFQAIPHFLGRSEGSHAMHWFQIAHLNIQGNDIIIIPFSKRFAQKPRTEREQTVRDFQQATKKAGLKGVVVPIWPNGDDIQFIAPKPWHPFFQKVSWPWIENNLNKEILV
ncbi:MAG: hypothetical protein AAGH41_04550 [Pseudomonadota bacterium]